MNIIVIVLASLLAVMTILLIREHRLAMNRVLEKPEFVNVVFVTGVAMVIDGGAAIIGFVAGFYITSDVTVTRVASSVGALVLFLVSLFFWGAARRERKHT
jgi:hypothetical protein